MVRPDYVHRSHYFYGNKVSDYGIENNRIDYLTLAKSFDCVLANDLFNKLISMYYAEPENGSLYDEDDEPIEVFQWWLISSMGAEILEELTDEIVYYFEETDTYFWGVTHWGTSWDYVLTNIKIDLEEGWD